MSLNYILNNVDYYVKGKKLIEITFAEAKKIVKDNEEAMAKLTEIITNNTDNKDFLRSHSNEWEIRKDAKLVIDKKGKKYIAYKSLEYYENKNFPEYKQDQIKRWAVNKYLIK